MSGSGVLPPKSRHGRAGPHVAPPISRFRDLLPAMYTAAPVAAATASALRASTTIGSRPMAEPAAEVRIVIVASCVRLVTPTASITVTTGVYEPGLAYSWVTVGPVARVPSPKSHINEYPPSPPVAVAANLIVSPEAADVADDLALAIAREAATPTLTEGEAVPPTLSGNITLARYVFGGA